LLRYQSGKILSLPLCVAVLTPARAGCRAQTALVLRLGEKRVLHRTVELVSQVWSMLLVEGWRE